MRPAPPGPAAQPWRRRPGAGAGADARTHRPAGL